MRAARLTRGRGVGQFILLGAALFAGCARQGDVGSEDSAAARGEMATVAGVPACQFNDSGTELAERPSPPDSAMAQLGDGIAKVCYSAPSARGRQVMGVLVPFGEPWRLGANEATTLHVTVPAEVGSVRVEPGSYSIYAIPGESEWTIVVNRATGRWGIPINEGVRAQDVGSFTVPRAATDQQAERFSINLEPADAGAAQMAIAWEGTRVVVPIRPAGT
ncbi:MAG TPA: DUF2911 domain-containing protein [Gemmatimonadaceae bacterium]|nr:DUF2911 domain-containing protein [Gemmatimonadaceae bacterium]